MLPAAIVTTHVPSSSPGLTLTSESLRRNVMNNRKGSETASALALGARGGTKLRSTQLNDRDRLQLDALLLWLLPLLLRPHTGERMSESRR